MTPILASLGRLKHEICEFEDSSGYIERLFFSKIRFFPHTPAILVEGHSIPKAERWWPQRKQTSLEMISSGPQLMKSAAMHAGLQADSEGVQRRQSTRVHPLQRLSFEKTETEHHTRLAKAVAHRHRDNNIDLGTACRKDHSMYVPTTIDLGASDLIGCMPLQAAEGKVGEPFP